MQKLFRISTVPMSLNILLKGQLRYLNQFYDVTAISGAGEDMDEVLRREGVKGKEIEMSREISIFKDLEALISLYLYFKKEKPQIVHSITPKAGLLSMVAAKMAGVPIRMHTFTGLIFPSKKGVLKMILIWMDRLLAKCATHIYPEGKGVRDDLLKYRITTKPLKIIANGNVNGIETAYFNRDQISVAREQELKNQLGISDSDFVFIFVGRLVKDKGINELVSAFKNIVSPPLSKRILNHDLDHSTQNPASSIRLSATKQPPTKLILVGPLEEHLDPLNPETLKEIENNPHIISVGFQQEVRSYFATSNALVFPSYREGFPNVVLQAGSMGLASIVTNINGCNEIIQDEVNGLIIPAKNTEALAAAMQRMIAEVSLYESFRQNARPKIVANYEQKLVWEAILAEYRYLGEEESSN